VTIPDIRNREQECQVEQTRQQEEQYSLAAKIISIIGMGKISQTEVERSIRFVEGLAKTAEENAAYTFSAPTTKAEKEADKRTGAALRRLTTELSKPHRNRFVASFFDLDLLKKLVSHCERRAIIKLPNPKRQDGAAKRAAAHEAARLLQLAGLPLNLTRDGKFCQLTAILDCGDARQAKHYQPTCRVVKALRNRV